MFIYTHVCLETSDLLVKMILKNNSKHVTSEQADLSAHSNGPARPLLIIWSTAMFHPHTLVYLTCPEVLT